MTGHDPLCFEVDPWQQCICDQIERARADERERIAQVIEVCYFGEDAKAAVVYAYHRAARIARGES